jgi:membrane protease YdiL (CAAX protease family)
VTWRGAIADWKDLDRRRPPAWWLGLSGTLAGSIALAVLELRRMIPPHSGARRLAIACLLLAVVFVGRRLFWNDTERRLRMPWRIVGFGVFIAVIATAIRATGVHLEVDSDAGTGTMLRLTAMALAMITAASVLAVRLLDRRPLRELGIVPGPGFWGDLAFGLALGAALMTAIFAAEYAAGWVRIEAVAYTKSAAETYRGAALRMAGVFACVGFYEELASRGYLLRTLAQGFLGRRIGPSLAIGLGTLVSSLFFASGHADNPNATAVSTVNIVFAGMILALPYVLTGRLATSIGFHATWNYFQSTVYGFPTSGFEATAAALRIAQGGPPAWTGGLFGPEAGILGLMALVAGAAAILLREGWRNGRVTVCAALVVPALGAPADAVLTAGTPESPSAHPAAPAS